MSDQHLADQSTSAALSRAVLVWFALLGGIGAWAVHLVFVASWVRYSCTSGTVWPFHAVTVATVVPTLAALALSWRLLRHGGRDDAADDAEGRSSFLGLLGLSVGAFSLALILLEELYAIVLSGNRCG